MSQLMALFSTSTPIFWTAWWKIWTLSPPEIQLWTLSKSSSLFKRLGTPNFWPSSLSSSQAIIILLKVANLCQNRASNPWRLRSHLCSKTRKHASARHQCRVHPSIRVLVKLPSTRTNHWEWLIKNWCKWEPFSVTYCPRLIKSFQNLIAMEIHV